MPQTANNLDLFEVLSAMQKDIRRGNERQAMQWALELIPAYEAACWNRLVTIAHEDVGLADPFVLVALPTMRETYMEMRTRGDGGACLVLANAILMLARAPKCRLADEFQCVVRDDHANWPPERVPDYALDKHTAAGKRMGRGVDHWLTEGTHLDNVTTDVPNPYTEEAARRWRAGARGPDWPARKTKAAQTSLFD